MISIDIINETTMITDADMLQKIKAIQAQVDIDLPKAWAVSPIKLYPVSKGQSPTKNHWWIVLLDNSDIAGALGYHTLTNQGLPCGKVFPGTCIQYKTDWGVDLSHEVLEALIDPYCQLCAQDENGVFWAYEVGDPVESDASGYHKLVEGVQVLVSDFVYPAWFDPSATGKQFSHNNSVTQPFTLASGGYASQLLVGASSWSQVFGDTIRPMKVGTRRYQRFVGRKAWEWSTAHTQV
jgi:hypothetical protein